MKKYLAFALALTLAPALAMAKGGDHPMAGCGLGYVLFGHSDNSRIMQILAATTNGTSGNQTFGMSSGTSGCTEDGAVKFVKEAEVYAEVNLDSLRHEIATGEGEFVNAFASLLTQEASQSNVVALMKINYAHLFTSETTTSTELLANLKTVFARYPGLLS